MLDTRLYRAAFAPVLVAIVVAAFALGDRARPIGTTLAPDAFDGRRAFATLSELARTFPTTRPGSPADDALAERVAGDLRAAGFDVRTPTTTAQTVDGEQRLTTVIGERSGLDPGRIVVVAHRDRLRTDDAARLSGTAALLELARLYRGRPTRRTLTLVSVSGGSGGLAGARHAAAQLDGPVNAVLVVGDIAGTAERRPFVIPWSESGGAAPMRLRRTVEEAVRMETERDPGSSRALVQLARLAMPLAPTGQGAFGGAGLSAVMLQASGERGPDADAAEEVSRARLQAFGRGLLRAVSALDNGPAIPQGPREYIVFGKRVMPNWAVSVIAALLLLPAVIGAVDGLARVRRHRRPVAIWLRWLAAAAMPFLLAWLFARALGLVGVVPAVGAPVAPEALPPRAGPVIAVALSLVLGLLLRAPLARMLGAPSLPAADDVPGTAAAVALATSAIAVVIWAFNPYTALLLAPAVHVWLLAAAPEIRLPRPALALLVPLALLPFAGAIAVYATRFDLGLGEILWEAVVLLAGGTVGPLGALAWSVVLGCGLGALLVAVRKRRGPPPGDPGAGPITIRGPLTYAGPGSLGGTESAIGR